MTTGVPVVKTNGTGNDFVLVDERLAPVENRAAFAVRICDRAHGLGADGVLFVMSSDTMDARMRIFNADGSEAEMCGNGMRCVARYLDERDGYHEATVETLAGPIHTRIVSRAPYRVAVEMGEPRIGAAHLDRLEAEGGACIMYTHFGLGFWDGRIHPRFAESMSRLARRNGWFVPVSELLDYLLKQRGGPSILQAAERRELERRWLLHKVRFGNA